MSSGVTRRKTVILLLGAALMAILLASLLQRFAHPDLTINGVVMERAPDKGELTNDTRQMDAIGELMRAVAQNPKDGSTLLRLVEALMAVGQWQSAENFAHKALELDSAENQNPRALYLLALIHHNMGRQEQAAELLEKLLEKSENPSARYSLGILYLHYLNNPAKGIEQLQKGLAVPDAPQSLKTAIAEELRKAAGAPEQTSIGKQTENPDH